MKKKFLLFQLFTLIISIGFSAEKIILIKGKIIDKSTQEAIPYANIGVLDSYIGNASNLDGDFEVKIPSKYKDRKIQVSAVGYKTFFILVSEAEQKDFLLIELAPQNYKLQVIEIVSESKVYMKVLKTAIHKLNDNYLQTPFNYDVYYKEEKKVNNKLEILRQAAVKIYDNNGYRRGNTYTVFKERTYKFLQVKKNFESNSLLSGSTSLDDLLEMDIVRVRGNVLDSNYLAFYDFKLDKITSYDNDSIWVIDYESKKPSLSSTGDYYADSYKGKIYINQKDFAVVKNETWASSKNYSKLGRSFYVNEKRQIWKPIKIDYHFTVIYKKHDLHYYLSYVNYERHHDLKHKDNSQKKTEELHTEMVINKIITKKPEEINKRSYYENIKYNKRFWKNYNFIVDRKK